MATRFIAGEAKRGKLPIVSINAVLVDYALSFALLLDTGNMRRESLPIFIITISMPVPSFVFVSLAHLNSAFEVEKRLAAVRAVALGMPNFAAVGYRCFTPYMANTKPAPIAQTPSLPEQNANTRMAPMPAVHWPPRDAV
jgi:hypothetical protein